MSRNGVGQKATNVRWGIFILMLILGTINYIDRASLAIAMPHIAAEFNIQDARIIGWLNSMFFWAYALMQLPCGILADALTPRVLIVTATVVWGTFQGLGALCGGTTTFALTRLGLGVAEAPVMPAGTKLMGQWLTPNERGRGSMLLDGGAPLGTATGAVILTTLIALFNSWRIAFLIAGVGTVLVGIAASYYIRSRPSEHPGVNAAERAWIEAGTQKAAKAEKFRFRDVLPYLGQRNVLALIGGWCCYSTVFYGLMTWTPMYLQVTYGFDLKSMGASVALMFFLCFVGQQIGGFITDKWRKAGGRPNTVFHTMFAISAIVAGVSLFAVTHVTNHYVVIALLSISLFPLRWASLYWSIPGLLGAQAKAGTICGTMNFCSNLTAAIVPILVGMIVQSTGSYFGAMMLFSAAAAGYLLCSLSLNFNRTMAVSPTTLDMEVEPVRVTTA
ncbi:MAG: MFS transporter [Acetobacteraceae bacterium]|nr:MFS transporter [Acetobacteraceae bacterium]